MNAASILSLKTSDAHTAKQILHETGSERRLEDPEKVMEPLMIKYSSAKLLLIHWK